MSWVALFLTTVSDRIIKIWPSVIKIVNHWSSFPPSKEPKCKSYKVLKNALKDPFVVAKFNFFSFLARCLLPYLSRYQLQKPMISFLHDDIQQLVKELLSLTIKSEVIGNCKEDYYALLKIDLRDVRSLIKKNDIHVGFVTLDELQSLLRKDLISLADIIKFRIETREFLVTLQEKMFRKNPLSFNIVKYMSVFNPKVLLNQAPSVCKCHYLENWCVRLLDRI